MRVDSDLPGVSGVDFIRIVKHRHPVGALMAFTILEDRETIFSTIKDGASGYLVEGSAPRACAEPGAV